MLLTAHHLAAISRPRLWEESREEAETPVSPFCFPCASSPKNSVEIEALANNGNESMVICTDFNFVVGLLLPGLPWGLRQ